MAIRTITFVSRLKPGAAQQLIHELPAEFPGEALGEIDGIKKVTVCQGNGLFVVIAEYKGDFEEIFRAYVESPAINAFHAKMAKFLEDRPRSRHPADLPLAGDVFYWDGGALETATD